MKIGLRIGIMAGFVALLGLGIWKSNSSVQPHAATQSNQPQQAASAATQKPQSITTVRLLTGSAKFGFLNDPQVVKLLEDKGFRLQLSKSGAFASDVTRAKEFDAVWPAGANASRDFATAWNSKETFPIFSTPLAIASWKQLAPVLTANGLAKMEPNHGTFYLAKALPLMMANKRWNQLKDNTVFDVNKGFLVNTPDIRKSNTGMLYLGALAYIANQEEVPSDIATGEALAAKLAGLITRQGFQEDTLAGPFEDYIGQGMGKAPLVLIYESQFVEAKHDGKLRPNHILLYPQPGLVLKHVLVANSPQGAQLGNLLANDPDLQRIAASYGFRTNNPGVFVDAMANYGLDAPELNNLADAPNTVVLDAMTKVLINKLEGN